MVNCSVHSRPGTIMTIQFTSRHLLILWYLERSLRRLSEILVIGQVIVSDSWSRLHLGLSEPRIISKCSHFWRLCLHLGGIHNVLMRHVRNELFQLWWFESFFVTNGGFGTLAQQVKLGGS